MNQGLKWLLAGIGTFVVLFVIAAVVLPMAVDPNNYKQDIRTAVLEKTGRELIIGGEIKWTVFPWIGIDISDMELGRPFDLEGGFAVNLVQSQFAGEVRFSGRVQSTPDGKRYGIERLKLSFKGEHFQNREKKVQFSGFCMSGLG